MVAMSGYIQSYHWDKRSSRPATNAVQGKLTSGVPEREAYRVTEMKGLASAPSVIQLV